MKSELLGDVLLTFGPISSVPPVRFQDAPWQLKEYSNDWKFSASIPGRMWKGFPSAFIQSDSWQLWGLGKWIADNAHFIDLSCAFGDSESLGQMIARVNGRFLFLGWHLPTHQWHLWTDRFGTIQVYFANSGNRAAISTFSPAAAAISSRKLDWQGLAGFFSFGFFPQDRTHFDDVRILRPASHYTFDETGRLISSQRYWQWWHTPNTARSYADTLSEFAGIFHQVMADATAEGRVAVPISGGLDSRSTVAPLSSTSGDRLWSYSYGYSDDSIETRIARQAAEARNLPFQAFTIRPYLFENIERVISWTEGFQDITQARQAFVRDDIAAHAGTLVAALWGDVWHDDMGVSAAKKNTYNSENQNEHDWLTEFAVHKIEKGGRAWLLDNLVIPQLGERPEHLLRDMMRSEIASLNHIADPDFRIKAFKTEQWSFRWSLPPTRVFQSAAWPWLVFYDTRLVDFFCAVPTDYVSGRQLQIDYLKRFTPDLARIRWQVYDANLFEYQHFNTWLLPRRAMKKAERVLRGQKVLERNWEVQFLNASGRVGLNDWLLRPGLRLHEFISPQELQQLLDAFYLNSTEDKRGYTVSMLLTFSAWLEQFG